jgi:periplasmic protein TonB
MKKPYVMLLSLLLQIFGLAVLALIPLIHPQVLPSAQLRTVLAAPAPPRPAPLAQRSVKVFTRPLDANLFRLFAPRVIPRQVNPVENIASAPDVGVPDGVPSGTGTSEVLRNLLLIVPVAPPPPPPPAVKKMAAGPVHVSSGVVESNLIHRVQPAYPALAKSARVQGTVEFTAIISKQGTIQNLQLVRGHPLLVSAAREAILQWQYRPTLLNGEPVEVITNILVNFTLSQ